jgi:hypothetical protein
MPQHETNLSQNFQHVYIVNPPVKAMRVPVLRDPAQGNDVLIYLKADTAVEVLSRSELWLRIQLPGNQVGYIQVMHARLATSDEQLAAQMATQKQDRILTTQAGLSGPVQPGPHFQVAFSLLMIAVGSLALAILISFFVKGACQSSETQCASTQTPLAIVGVILFLIFFLFLILGVIAGIISIVQSRRLR